MIVCVPHALTAVGSEAVLDEHGIGLSLPEPQQQATSLSLFTSSYTKHCQRLLRVQQAVRWLQQAALFLRCARLQYGFAVRTTLWRRPAAIGPRAR
jgi:hypothetical protein